MRTPDTTNRYFVGGRFLRRSDRPLRVVHIGRPVPPDMTPEDAAVLGAWLLAVAQVMDFELDVDAIRQAVLDS